MNWFKTANTSKRITRQKFLGMNVSQKLSLVKNKSITPEVQKMFFTENYEDKGRVLYYLAHNTSITPEVQTLFWTQNYEDKGRVLIFLAGNRSLTPEMQTLFWTQNYEDKGDFLRLLARNPSFLRGFTREQLLLIKKLARGETRLKILKKRLEQVQGSM